MQDWVFLFPMENNPQLSALAQRVSEQADRGDYRDLLLTRPLVVGVSGGADSLVLLHLLCELRQKKPASILHIAHLDHGFRGEEGAADAGYVAKVAAELGVPCTLEYFDVPGYAKSAGLSPEEAARRARYAFLAGVASREGGTVAVAHTADDQAETVLMHILRGSGTRGLAGIKSLSKVPLVTEDPALTGLLAGETATGLIVFRPMLGVWRHEVELYCRERGITPRTDATNLDLRYTRNRLRHEILPMLEQESHAVKSRLITLSKIASAESRLLDEMAQEAVKGITVASQPRRWLIMQTEGVALLPIALRRRVAQIALELVAGTLLGFTFGHIEEAAKVLAGESRAHEIHLPGGIGVGRQAGRSGVYNRTAGDLGSLLTLEDAGRWPAMPAGAQYNIEPNRQTPLAQGWKMSVKLHTQESREVPGSYLAQFDHARLQALGGALLRIRRPGDHIRPLGMEGRKSLQDLLVDAKIPKEVRATLPIMALQSPAGELLWVPGPGGRRSRWALITEETREVLSIEFA